MIGPPNFHINATKTLNLVATSKRKVLMKISLTFGISFDLLLKNYHLLNVAITWIRQTRISEAQPIDYLESLIVSQAQEALKQNGVFTQGAEVQVQQKFWFLQRMFCLNRQPNRPKSIIWATWLNQSNLPRKGATHCYIYRFWITAGSMSINKSSPWILYVLPKSRKYPLQAPTAAWMIEMQK